MSSTGNSLASNIIAAVGSNTTPGDNSGAIVREAVESAVYKFPFKLNTPKDFGTILMSMGFYATSGEPQQGDVGIWAGIGSHPSKILFCIFYFQ